MYRQLKFLTRLGPGDGAFPGKAHRLAVDRPGGPDPDLGPAEFLVEDGALAHGRPAGEAGRVRGQLGYVVEGTAGQSGWSRRAWVCQA